MFSKVRCSLFTQSRIVVFLVIVALALGSVADAACRNTWGSFQRWRWWDLYWDYTGAALPTQGMTDALAAWATVTAIVPIQFTRSTLPASDIRISDFDLPDELAGFTQTFTANTNASCGGKLELVIGPEPNQCNARYCWNSSMIWYATIQLDSAQIMILQSELQSTLNAAVQMVMVHEIGHTLDLNDEGITPTPTCSDPTVMNGYQAANCGLYTPQQCDSSTFYSAYNGWLTYSWCNCDSSLSCS